MNQFLGVEIPTFANSVSMKGRKKKIKKQKNLYKSMFWRNFAK